MITKRDVKPGAAFITRKQRVEVLSILEKNLVKVVWLYEDEKGTKSWADKLPLDEFISEIKNWAPASN